MVPNEYFRTPARQRQLERSLRGALSRENELEAFGTVGAVALDLHGNLAAATSTGGMTGKRWGRVGDSPIIGAGTYANNAELRGVGHRTRRILHPHRGRARHLRAGGVPEDPAGRRPWTTCSTAR